MWIALFVRERASVGVFWVAARAGVGLEGPGVGNEKLFDGIPGNLAS
jgi:hypothetical protein